MFIRILQRAWAKWEFDMVECVPTGIVRVQMRRLPQNLCQIETRDPSSTTIETFLVTPRLEAMEVKETIGDEK